MLELNKLDLLLLKENLLQLILNLSEKFKFLEIFEAVD